MASVSVISEAMHSMMDLLAAVIANLSIRRSIIPPDEGHAYGHGKFESLAGVIEALLIFFVAGIILYESINRIIHGLEIQLVEAGLVVMGISAITNLLVSRYLLKVADEENSIALRADGLHLSTDVLTSLGVFVGLLLIRLTGLQVLDPIVAIIVAMMIMRTAWRLTKEASMDLCDVRLPPSEEAKIKEVLEGFSSEIRGYHTLRSRKSGSERFIDLHISFPSEMSVETAHKLATDIESAIEQALPGASVLVHIEPMHWGEGSDEEAL